MTTSTKKRIRISSPASDSEDVDEGNPKTHENSKNGDACRGKRLESKTCFVCDGKDNWVLQCHGKECPIAIHQSCTSDEPDFDEFGNYYCSYCWYKHVVTKSVKLQKKLMVIEKSRNGRDTLGEVDLGLVKWTETEDVENVVEVNVSGGKIINFNPSGKGDESYEKFMVMEKNQRMNEVATETHSWEVSEAGDDNVDEGRQQRGRFSEKIEETSDGCNSNAGEGRKGRERCSDINHETAQAHSFVAGVNTRKQRIYSEKSRKNKKACNSDLDGRRSGQGCCHEKNQQQKASSTESCEQKVFRTAKRHIETETREKEVSKKREREREGAVVRDGDEFYLEENQNQQFQADMRNDNATFNEQETCFRKDEQKERKSVSSISSPMSTDNVNVSNAASQELALVIHSKTGLQERPIKGRPIKGRPYCSMSPKKPSFQPKQYGHKSYQEKNGTASNDPGQRLVLCSDRKRKRLFWTQEEEEMLRVGVQKFPGVRNIPWRKILEFGREVFHDERVPSDLKDKWKKMNKSIETAKWVSLSTDRQQNHQVSEPFPE